MAQMGWLLVMTRPKKIENSDKYQVPLEKHCLQFYSCFYSFVDMIKPTDIATLDDLVNTGKY